MDEQQQQEQQKPGDSNTVNAANTQAPNPTGADNAKAQEAIDRQQKAKEEAAAADAEKAALENAKQQAGADPNAGKHVGLLGRLGHGIEGATGISAIERHEKRRQAFTAPNAKPVQDAVNDVNAFLNAMREGDFDTPAEMLADTDIQNAAKRAREGLKVFTGDTPVTFSKPTSDAHLNIGSGGAVTGNTPANKAKVADVRDEHDDDEETAAAGVTRVPQPDAHVR